MKILQSEEKKLWNPCKLNIYKKKWASVKVKMSKEDNIDKYKTLVSNLENELKSKGKKARN